MGRNIASGARISILVPMSLSDEVTFEFCLALKLTTHHQRLCSSRKSQAHSYATFQES